MELTEYLKKIKGSGLQNILDRPEQTVQVSRGAVS